LFAKGLLAFTQQLNLMNEQRFHSFLFITFDLILVTLSIQSTPQRRMNLMIQHRFLIGIVIGLVVLGLSFVPKPLFAQAEDETIVHTVMPGETLREIAESYGTTWEAMGAINRLTNPNVISVGQQLTVFGEIPEGYTWDTADVALASGIAPSAYVPTEVVHIVESGDTLGQIAERYGVPVAALAQVNNITNPSLIHVGQRIVIAGPPIPAAPEAPRAEGKVILVSVSEQYLWAYEDGEVQVESFVTTGRPGADTPIGSWEVLVKYTDYRFISPYPEGHEFYYNSQVSNYSLRYSWNGYHIHDAPWRSDYGPGTSVPHQDSLGRWQTGSIGCVNVTGDAMARLFEWAEVGTPIVVVE
jgi:LysM repeat protein